MLRILVVDDEPHIRSGLAAKVAQCGDDSLLVCGEASDGREALEWLESRYADICLTDIRMPVMDGLALIRAVNDSFPWMKCIIVSSYDDFAYAKSAMELHVTDYILKPVEREALTAAIDRARDELLRERLGRASRIVVDRLSESHGLLLRWIDIVRTQQSDKYPLLVVDTLQAMESWIQGDHHLLASLTTAWIELVAKEAKLSEPSADLMHDREIGYDRTCLTHRETRHYFRLAAVMRLERSILHLIEQAKKNSSPENAKIVSWTKRYIEEHYHEKFNAAELADLIPISRSYLAVLFKQHTGTTILSYVTDIRLKQAKLLMLDPKLKVYEVANRVGYENGEHFAKIFKDSCGITPKEYRKMIGLTVEV